MIGHYVLMAIFHSPLVDMGDWVIYNMWSIVLTHIGKSQHNVTKIIVRPFLKAQFFHQEIETDMDLYMYHLSQFSVSAV